MQERFYVAAGRGQGTTAPKPQPCPQSISIGYRCKTVCGLQNMSFPTGALPRTPLGELTTRTLEHLVGWGGDTPLHSTHSTRRLDSAAFGAVHSASRFEGHCPRQIFSSSTASPGPYQRYLWPYYPARCGHRPLLSWHAHAAACCIPAAEKKQYRFNGASLDSDSRRGLTIPTPP